MVCAATSQLYTRPIMSKVIRFIRPTIILKQVRVTYERIARITIWSVKNACLSVQFWSVKALEPRDCVIDLTDVDALILVICLTVNTASLIVIIIGSVSVSKLAIHRLKKAEVALDPV